YRAPGLRTCVFGRTTGGPRHARARHQDRDLARASGGAESWTARTDDRGRRALVRAGAGAAVEREPCGEHEHARARKARVAGTERAAARGRAGSLAHAVDAATGAGTERA